MSGRFRAFPWDYYSWDQPDVRWALGLRWIAGQLHPELFGDQSIIDAVYDFFSMAYGMSQDRVDSEILSLVGDAVE